MRQLGRGARDDRLPGKKIADQRLERLPIVGTDGRGAHAARVAVQAQHPHLAAVSIQGELAAVAVDQIRQVLEPLPLPSVVAGVGGRVGTLARCLQLSVAAQQTANGDAEIRFAALVGEQGFTNRQHLLTGGGTGIGEQLLERGTKLVLRFATDLGCEFAPHGLGETFKGRVHVGVAVLSCPGRCAGADWPLCHIVPAMMSQKPATGS